MNKKMCVTIILTIMCAVCFSLLLSVFVNRSFPQILAKFDSTTCGGLVNIGVFVEKNTQKNRTVKKRMLSEVIICSCLG